MAKAETSFLEFKGKPLVRKGNTLYYGDMNDPFVLMLSVADSHEVHGVQIADKVTVQLFNTDPTVNPMQALVKKTEAKGLWAAMDIGVTWLERAIQTAE